ncbi:MAG: thioredoxin family protein, partial [Acidobacteriota bacterium]|nr:thioredoxin family protein [Acidobacteriota bacterium]
SQDYGVDYCLVLVSEDGEQYLGSGDDWEFLQNYNLTAEFPEDAPERMVEDVEAFDYRFPYLVDGTQEIAKAYGAACTPDFFLYDAEGLLVYRGQLDDSRPGSDDPVTGADLRAAMDALVAGEPVSPEQTPSLGCNIKWKPGNAPDYFG